MKLLIACVLGLSYLINASAAFAENISMRDATKAEMKLGFDAMQAKTYAKALRHFENAQAIINRARDPAATVDSVMTRTAVRFVIAKAKADGNLGDPCPDFAQARTHALALGALVKAGVGDAPHGISSDEIIGDIDKSMATQRCANAVASTDAGDGKISAGANRFVGHYYLSGIHEVGSELRLRPNGTYDWFLAYGGMDQLSNGKWQQTGGEIVLTPDTANTKVPLFTAEPLREWDADAEEEVQLLADQEQRAKTVALCPFLADEDPAPATSAPMASLDVPREKSKAEKDREAAAAVRAERAARAAYEQLAARAAAAGPGDTEGHSEARIARKAWEDSRWPRRVALIAVGDVSPKQDTATLPAQCVIPDRYPARQIDPKLWQRGFAVDVHDPANGLNYSGINVTFRYSDGHEAKRVTDRGGDAWVPLRPGARVSEVRLTLDAGADGGPKTSVFPVTAPRDGILPFAFASDQVTAPPFETMRLKIDGADLIGFDGRGTYRRQ
jgi:hypothetical protein